MKRVAALDLGTNSFLCLVAEGDADGIKRIVRDEMRIVRLGQELNQRHEFHPEALKRADQALSDFRKVIDQLKVDKVLALATSAARDAKNKEDFFAIGKKYDIPLKIISGQDEARISYRGATATVNKTGLKKSQALVVDIGGGSTELILGQNEKVLFSQSLDIGGVRLTEEIVESQPVTDKVHKQLLQRVENDLEPALKKIKEHNVEKIIAVAGTPTALAAAALGEFNPTKIDGFVF